MLDQASAQPIPADFSASATNLAPILGTNTRRWLGAVNLLVLAVICHMTVFQLTPGERVGDGSEYYAMMVGWAENLTPYTTDRTGAIYDNYQNRPDGTTRFVWPYSGLTETFAHLRNAKGQQDYPHFWVYPLMAAVFYWPAKFSHGDIGLAFNLLHCALVLVCGWAIRKRFGQVGVSALLVLVVGSPMIWYINKVHGEFFSLLATATAIAILMNREYLTSAIWFALASTQNPPFALVSVFVLAVGFYEQGWQLLRSRPWAWVLLVVLLGLHPAYSYVRHGVLTPLLTIPCNNLGAPMSLRVVTSFWIDPDTGLLTNWPYACPMLAAFALLAWRKRLPAMRHVWIVVLFCVALFSWSHSRSSNLNHGAVLDISRYALWYLFLFFVGIYLVLRWLAIEGRQWRAVALACGVLLLYANARWFHPKKPAEYLSPSTTSYFVYQHLPGLYDPLPEIFAERYAANRGDEHDRVQCWAVAHPSGEKILVTNSVFTMVDNAPVPPVAGCEWLDAVAVRDIARATLMARPGRTHVYLNGWGQMLLRRKPAPDELYSHDARLAQVPGNPGDPASK